MQRNIDPNQVFRINEPDVVSQLFSDEVIAIHLPSGTYHSLTGSAKDVFWALSFGGITAPEIASYLAERYQVPRQIVDADVETFLGQLTQHSLAVRSEEHMRNALPRQEAPAGGYRTPSLQVHTELQALLLLDPVHDVAGEGWPNRPVAAPAVDLRNAPAYECQVAGPHIIFERFADETVVVDSATGAYYSLFGPAEDIFLLLSHVPTLEEIIHALRSKYCASDIDLELQVRQFLSAMQAAGLIIALPVIDEGTPVRELPLDNTGSALPFPLLSLSVFNQGKPASAPPATPGLLPAGRPIEYRFRRDGLLAGAVRDGMVIADMTRGWYFAANEPASFVLDLLRQPRTVEELATAVSRVYSSPAREVAAAMIIFLNNLKALDLVSAAERTGGPADFPALPEISPKRNFQGFELKMHRDLADLMAPFNPAHQPGSGDDSEDASMAEQLLGALRAWSGRVRHEERWFGIGGETFRLLKSPDVELDQAWSHLRLAGDSTADLTIHALMGGAPRDFFLSFWFEQLSREWTRLCGPRGEVKGLHSPDVAVIYHPGPHVLTVVDKPNAEAFYVKWTADPLPSYEIGAPFRYILHAWFARRGVQFIHGAAVATPENGVLLVGKGGSGKSTTALLCARAGMSYLGDDYCLVDPGQNRAYSIYATAKLKGPADVERVPELRDLSFNADGFEKGGEGKALYSLAGLWPDRLAASAPVKAILIPRVGTGPDTRLEPCGPQEALLAMLPSTVGQLPLADAGDCARLTQLAAKLPAYVLHIGTDLQQIPARVREVCG